MLTKLKLALLVSAPLVAGATYAIAGGPAHEDRIQRFDENGDGTLDDAERAGRRAALDARRAAHRTERLARYDANRDGTLDDAERAATRDARLAERFQVLDANHDGAVTLDEFKAGAARRGGHRHGRRGRQGHGPGMKP